MPKVTVLMPVYNAERYLRESIESILTQTLSDFEFLILDDGSSDNSLEIVRSYNDRRIRFIRNEQNLGISKTLNKGVQLASCDIIARMDADDISLPDRLMKQFTFLKTNPECSMVSSHVETISEHGKSLGKYQPESELFYYNLTFYCWIYHPSVMYRKHAVEEAGLYPLTYAEDYRLWSRLIRNHKFFNLPDILLKYRITNQSVSNSVFMAEYRDAEKQQIIENLRYFAGDDYTIPDTWLECYRNHFAPLCDHGRIRDIVQCIRELDVLTAYILEKENVNRDPQSIKRAAKLKKEHILESCLKRLPARKKVHLMIRTGSYRKLWDFLKTGIYNRTHKVLPSSQPGRTQEKRVRQ